ncbi:MAG: RNA-binding protein, partial [Dehalococcoidia bacterium]|nr:RNA-binding protein [Dehalococcoidia bacterium]
MASMMSNLIEYIAKSLVDEPDEVHVTEHDDHGRIIIHLDVAED